MTAETEEEPSEELAAILEEISVRVRVGEKPTPTEYAERFPKFAERIATLMPVLTALETTIDAPRLPPGTPDHWGDYRLLRAVGRGGMGTVYEATQKSLGRTVAVKVLNEHVSPAMLERFRRETRAAGRLQHPHIVPVYGVGDANGRSFYVMRYVRGIGLNRLLDLVRGGPAQTPTWLTKEGHIRAVARLIAEIAEGLAHAHENGVLHRDVKPANILVDGDRRAWITDFGLAKSSDDEDLTQPQELVGTVRYMAPERFRGGNGSPADIYALGATLYEALTLKAAFPQADRQELLYAVCHTRPPMPRALNRAVPKDLETIVLKAMEPDASQRYASAREMASDLRAYLADRGIAARRPSLWDEFLRWCRRYPAAAALSLGFVLLACFSALFFFLQNRKLNEALAVSRHNEREASVRQLELLISEASAIAQGGRMGRSHAALKTLREAQALASTLGLSAETRLDLRNGTVAALALPDLAPEPMPHLGNDLGQGFAFHPRADLFAQRDGDIVRIRRLSTGETLRILRPSPEVLAGSRASNIHFSPTGRRLVVGDHGLTQADFFDLTDARPTPANADPALACCFFRPGTDDFAAVDAAGLTVWTGMTRAKTIPLPAVTKGKHWNAAIHPTKPLIFLFHYWDMRSLLLDLETGAILDDRTTQDRITGVAWHPDGRTLLVAGHSDTSWLRFFKFYDLASGGLVLGRIREVQDTYVQLRYDAAGERIVAAGWTAFVSLFDAHGGHLFTTPSYRDGYALDWDRAGRTAGLYLDGTRFHGLNVGDGRLFRRIVDSLDDPKESIGTMKSSPDGRWLVHEQLDHLAFVEIAGGQPLLKLPKGDRGFGGLTRTGEVILGKSDRREFFRIDAATTEGGPGLRATMVRSAAGQRSECETPDGRVRINFIRTDRTVTISRADGTTRELPTGLGVHYASLSPDGRWAAFAGWVGQSASLWNLETGRPEPLVDLTAGGGFPLFSPCGRKLWISGRGGRFLDVGTWAEGPVVGRSIGTPAYSPDGKVIAIEDGTGVVRLASVETSETIVLLSHPNRVPSVDLAFTPDGNQLLLRNGQAPYGIYAWEISSIRKYLRDHDLDWE